MAKSARTKSEEELIAKITSETARAIINSPVGITGLTIVGLALSKQLWLPALIETVARVRDALKSGLDRARDSAKEAAAGDTSNIAVKTFFDVLFRIGTGR